MEFHNQEIDPERLLPVFGNQGITMIGVRSAGLLGTLARNQLP